MAKPFKKKRDKRRKGASWYIKYKDAGGRWKTAKGCADYRTTQEIGNKLQADADLQRRGVVTPAQASCADNAKVPLSDHVDSYIKSIEARGRNGRYSFQIKSRINALIEYADCTSIKDITADKVTDFILSLKRRKLSGFTVKEYLMNLKAFTVWATRTSRLPYDPLSTVFNLDGKAIEKKRPRRALSAKQIGALLEVTRERPLTELLLIRRGARKGQLLANVRPVIRAKAEAVGFMRYVAYLLILWTGLRRSEAGAVTWGMVKLDSLPARIVLPKRITKNKKDSVIALHPQIATLLREYRPKDHKPGDKVLGAVPSMKVLKADLMAAGIEFETPEGRIDLHAMRKSLNTYLADNGVSDRKRQAQMRHSDVRLTTGDTYIDEGLLDVAASISQVPELPTSGAKKNVAGVAG